MYIFGACGHFIHALVFVCWLALCNARTNERCLYITQKVHNWPNTRAKERPVHFRLFHQHSRIGRRKGITNVNEFRDNNDDVVVVIVVGSFAIRWWCCTMICVRELVIVETASHIDLNVSCVLIYKIQFVLIVEYSRFCCFDLIWNNTVLHNVRSIYLFTFRHRDRTEMLLFLNHICGY